MEKKEAALTILKATLSIVTSLGMTALCGAFASNIAETNGMKNTERACVGIAGAVMGGMLGDRATTYIEDTIDSVVRTYETVKEAWQTIKKEDKAE